MLGGFSNHNRQKAGVTRHAVGADDLGDFVDAAGQGGQLRAGSTAAYDGQYRQPKSLGIKSCVIACD
jgi:hypothetical protein